MTPLHNKILCEVELEEEKSGVIVPDKEKKPYPFLETTIMGFGDKVSGVKIGGKLVVFNVYPNQIFEYKGKKIIFVNYNDSMCFVK